MKYHKEIARYQERKAKGSRTRAKKKNKNVTFDFSNFGNYTMSGYANFEEPITREELELCFNGMSELGNFETGGLIFRIATRRERHLIFNLSHMVDGKEYDYAGSEAVFNLHDLPNFYIRGALATVRNETLSKKQIKQFGKYAKVYIDGDKDERV